jgi:glycosyltransferase involved in cell wall biosynthesis
VIRPAIARIPLICHLVWSLNSLLEVRRFAHQDRPDVIVALTLTNSHLLAQYAKKLGIPLVYMELEPYHSMVPQRWVQPLTKIVERLALRSADRVLVFTPQMQDYVKNMGAGSEKVSILKTGVSLDIFHPNMDGREQRNRMGIAQDEWVLFFMGWLYDFSGLREIVQAISNDPKLMENARLVIVGDGDLYEELRNRGEKGGLEDRVLLTGRRPYTEVPGLLSVADVCLMPSVENDITREIVPMKVYEYLAAGKPVAASRLPGMVAEFGAEQDRGITYGNNPLEVFLNALALRNQPERVTNLSLAGRKTAEQNADWEKTSDQFESLLLDMCAKDE